MHKAGQDPARVIQCRVLNVNFVNWTVDVISQYDRHYYFDIQVAAPYLHFNNGEGVYCVPDIGAVCMVVLPSDTSPPFVQSYVAPMEVAGASQKPLGDPKATLLTDFYGDDVVDPGQVSGQDAPNGTRSRGGPVPNPQTDAKFDAGRRPGKPGDIVCRGRDGNFVVLHRGGVLQIGANELSQRIYIPLGNKVFDISGDYEHQNIGGSISWGIQEVAGVDNPPAQHVSCYRIFANDQFCEIKVAKGKVLSPVGEPDGEAGGNDDIAEFNIGTDYPIVYEVAMALGGFKSGSGDTADSNVRNRTTLRYFFDRAGGAFMRCEGNVAVYFKNKLRVRVTESIDLICKTLNVQTKEGLQLGGGPISELKGDVVKLQGGTNPVARMGDAVALTLPTASMTGTVGGNAFTGVVTFTTPVPGVIIGGNPNLLG